jgi:hypothetical protein
VVGQVEKNAFLLLTTPAGCLEQWKAFLSEHRMYDSHTLASSTWYVRYNKSLDQFDRDQYAWKQAYPHRVQVEIPLDRYQEAIEWLVHNFGSENATDLSEHIFHSRWCRFHPTTDVLTMEEGTFVASLFGFKSIKDAVMFKLSWMQ